MKGPVPKLTIPMGKTVLVGPNQTGQKSPGKPGPIKSKGKGNSKGHSY